MEDVAADHVGFGVLHQELEAVRGLLNLLLVHHVPNEALVHILCQEGTASESTQESKGSFVDEQCGSAGIWDPSGTGSSYPLSSPSLSPARGSFPHSADSAQLHLCQTVMIRCICKICNPSLLPQITSPALTSLENLAQPTGHRLLSLRNCRISATDSKVQCLFSTCCRLAFSPPTFFFLILTN